MISKDIASCSSEAAPETKVPPHAASEGKSRGVHTTLRKKAMDLLARREHAVVELQQKVQAYAKKQELDEREVAIVIEELLDDGLVSDERFTEAFVRYRRNNGYGPRRIQTELRERGVSEKIQAAYLDFADPQWLEQVAQVRCKRFGESLPEDYKERARQARFLQYRGFTTDQARWALAGDDAD